MLLLVPDDLPCARSRGRHGELRIRHIYVFLTLRELQHLQEQKDTNRILEQCDKYSMRMCYRILGEPQVCFTYTWGSTFPPTLTLI